MIGARDRSTATPSAVNAFFDAAWRAFEAAESRIGRRAFHQRIGPASIRLRFAGSALASLLTPALAGVTTGDAPGPALCDIGFWDSATSGVPMPRPPWSLGDYDDLGFVRQSPTGDVTAGLHVEGRVLQLYRAHDRRALWWIPDLTSLPTHELAAPGRVIYTRALAKDGLHAIHAAAIGTPHGAVLLAGRGGSGKSTIAIGSLITSNLSYISDDYCVASAGDRPSVHALYGTGKLRMSDLDRWHSLSGHADAGLRVDDKAVFFVGRDFPDRILDDAPIAAVIAPAVRASGPTGFRPASAGEAVMALAPSTTSQVPASTGDVVRAISAIVRRVPCWHLDIRAGDESAPALIESWLGHV
jgi:hypothetical protein